MALEIINIRPVNLDKDTETITKIYNYYVTETCVTFETDPVTTQEMRERIERIVSKFPYLVATSTNPRSGQETVIGYSYANTFRSRPAYDWTVELSIILDKDTSGKGIGTRLYQELIQGLKDQGFVVAMAVITVPANEASVRFHEKLGFSSIGISEKCGYKMNQWHGVHFLELRLNEPSDPPPKIFVHKFA